MSPIGVPDEVVPFMRHRSVRQFAPEKMKEEVVQGLIACAQSSATSSNLQLWSVVTVNDPSSRQKLFELCGKQQQVLDAPWFFCFLCDHHRLRSVAREADSLDFADYFLMGVVDAALAAERMLCAAESLGLGGCYIGGLRNNPQGVADLLKLPDGVFGVFGMTLGYPADDVTDATKPRLPQDSVWHKETYDERAGIGDYDRRMSEYYRETGQNPDVTWSQRSTKRLAPEYMNGREVIREWLEDHKLNRR